MYACNTDGRWQGWQKWDTSWYLANRSSLGEPIAFTHWFADESLNPCFTVGGWGYAPSGSCSEARRSAHRFQRRPSGHTR